jgi:hypothetical protein
MSRCHEDGTLVHSRISKLSDTLSHLQVKQWVVQGGEKDIHDLDGKALQSRVPRQTSDGFSSFLGYPDIRFKGGLLKINK